MIEILILAGALLAQDSKAPQFVKFDIARERVGHKVIVEAALRNAGAAELSGARATAIYYDGDRELRRSPAVPVPKIAPGATGAFKIETEQVANFTRYEVYLETGSTTILYLGTDPAKPPAPRAGTAPRLSVVSHKVEPLTLVVRNSGGSPADEPTAALVFRNASSGVVHQVRVRLEKQIAPASEETFEITVPGVPAHASVEATVAWQAADEIAVNDPAGGAPEVALRQCRAVRLTDGAARVSGLLANPTDVAVQKVAARFRLGSTDAPYELPGILKAGESRPFVFYVPVCPAFDAVSFALSYESASAKSAAAPPAVPSSRRTGSRPAEAEAVRIPPPPKALQEAASNEVRPPSVGIRGLLVVEGTYKGAKYSGDVYLMRMIFLDEKAKPWQPEATVQFTLYDGPKQVRKASRTITKEGWKADASKVNSATVEMDTIAYDRKTQELWVAIHWTDGPFAKPRADLVVEIKDVGTYTLKGVEKDWAFAPQWPDGK